jgi:hypothetical protein
MILFVISMIGLFTEYLGFSQRITFSSNYCRILSENIWKMSEGNRRHETPTPKFKKFPIESPTCDFRFKILYMENNINFLSNQNLLNTSN